MAENKKVFHYLARYSILAQVAIPIYLLLATHTNDNSLYVESMTSGLAAKPGQWPFYVWLRTKQRSCGGVVLDPRSILTLSSCLKSDDDAIASIQSIYVGSVRRDIGVRLSVSHSCIPTATSQSMGADGKPEEQFALLRLTESLEFDTNVDRVKVTKEFTWNSTFWGTCYVIGAGFTGSLGTYNKFLKYNEIQMRYCIGMTRNSSTLCFRHLGQQVGVSCKGDIGGPVVCEKDDNFWLIGLVSKVAETCEPYSAALALHEALDFSKFLNNSLPDCTKWFDSIKS